MTNMSYKKHYINLLNNTLQLAFIVFYMAIIQNKKKDLF